MAGKEMKGIVEVAPKVNSDTRRLQQKIKSAVQLD
jgi:hypothetical protein